MTETTNLYSLKDQQALLLKLNLNKVYYSINLLFKGKSNKKGSNSRGRDDFGVEDLEAQDMNTNKKRGAKGK